MGRLHQMQEGIELEQNVDNGMCNCFGSMYGCVQEERSVHIDSMNVDCEQQVAYN